MHDVVVAVLYSSHDAIVEDSSVVQLNVADGKVWAGNMLL